MLSSKQTDKETTENQLTGFSGLIDFLTRFSKRHAASPQGSRHRHWHMIRKCAGK